MQKTYQNLRVQFNVVNNKTFETFCWSYKSRDRITKIWYRNWSFHYKIKKVQKQKNIQFDNRWRQMYGIIRKDKTRWIWSLRRIYKFPKRNCTTWAIWWLS